MFITEQGSEARALSLTMVPRKVPPREVFLKLDDLTIAAGYVSNPKAERWERSKPYIETIRTVFRNLALGEVPTGYNISSIPNTIVLPSCNQPGMDVSFSGGQLMTGHSLSVFVGVAENLTSQPQEFIEASCGNWDVAAVSTWPLKVLEPGQRTEVYVAQKQVRDRTSSSKRPSLLGGRK
jgi:conjugal transfer pilus assembly protein TraK